MQEICKYSADGKVNVIGGCSLPTTLGVFILWLGFGFNGGSQLALGSGADATAADIFVNTNLAAAGGVSLYDCSK